jgi:HSP20 family molecular chaperone IbpA
MVSEPSGDGEGPVPDAVDRVVRRLDAHRSLPPIERSNPPALGPPSAVTDESRLVREPAPEIVVDPSCLYITLELRGASRETLEVTTTERRLTVHALDAEGHVYHREVELPQPVEPDAESVTYRNGVLDVTLRRVRAHRVRVKRGT